MTHTPIVACSGGFDPVHKGHIEMIEAASKFGSTGESRVHIYLNSDEWLLRKKGFIFMPWSDRAAILMSIKGVEMVIPDELIKDQIIKNQSLIKNWVKKCIKTDEQICVVSAGPQLIPEIDVMEDYKKGKKIIAVKHALGPLKAAGIKPWACILLDPRPHVYDFVQEPDTDIIWFVASQVNPEVTTRLLAKGCTVWGYHATVGAGETDLIQHQPGSIISGGSATATRGLFLLKHLGFYKIKLFGYDLCFPDKVNLDERDDMGQPKYLEISVGWNDPLNGAKKCFWSKPPSI